MTALPVEWVLVIHYGSSAHRATYGRLSGTSYTKDYIQLYKSSAFADTLKTHFPSLFTGNESIPLVYKWPSGTTLGALVRVSADRPHLKWDTARGAPQAWKMSLAPNEAAAETIPGDPTHLDSIAADHEFTLLQTSGAGQPYLMAIKLRDEPATLHLRAYLEEPSDEFSWASMQNVPQEIHALAKKTTKSKALAWSSIESGGLVPSSDIQATLQQLATTANLTNVLESLNAEAGKELSDYLRSPAYGLFFDPSRNHDAWINAPAMPPAVTATTEQIIAFLETRFPPSQQGDSAAETFEVSLEEVEDFRAQIEQNNFAVPDTLATTKTRGSAQRAFAEAVKKNYGFKCAITGIKTKNFLIASHIVPWSQDHSIRIDPSNGICLSLLVDRAFEAGYLTIDDELTVHIEWSKLSEDEALKNLLAPHDGQKLRSPEAGAPKIEYLQRRRALLTEG
ncbi:HNH endonuclease [Stutzerimonas stutzeri]|uniref:HNH endonuclease n=1 Tax=Stutzerimonas stutzeri TaxID=316 RepID=UPI00210BB59C|nr:HNH endonuclease [Stutzerimonas stutzeri]MCQ4243174.1 HNH endonuclease [Stutzerimonas stutzeri]